MGDRARDGIDALGRRYGIPLHSTGLGHVFGMHWAEERVVDLPTRMASDREKIVNLHLALMNEGCYQMSLGYFLLSSAVGETEVDEFLAALEGALHTLGYVS
jgi:glutamate-1-semialdehyde aminotransferase